MAHRLRLAGQWVEVKRHWVRRAGQWIEVKRKSVVVSDAPRTYYEQVAPLSVVASGYTYGGASQSGELSAVVTGGQAPFAYLWSLVDKAGPASVNIVSPAMATSPLEANNASTTPTVATFRAVVTDALSRTAQADVSVEIVREVIDLGGPVGGGGSSGNAPDRAQV